MPTIHLSTAIRATREVCFDLARNIDLHMVSTADSGERAIAGRTSGLIELGETVTWRARHFGIWQTLTSKIIAFDRPDYFADEMVEGAFQAFRHDHRFETRDQETVMLDVFDYTSPLGILGQLADALILERYMRKLLIKRNAVIRYYAERRIPI